MQKSVKCTYVLKDSFSNKEAYEKEEDTFSELDKKIANLNLLTRYANGFEKKAIQKDGYVYTKDGLLGGTIYVDGQKYKPDIDKHLGKSVYNNFDNWQEGDPQKILIKTDTLRLINMPKESELHVGTIDVLIGYENRHEVQQVLNHFNDFMFGADQIKEQPAFDAYNADGTKINRTKKLMKSFGIRGELQLCLYYQGRFFEIPYEIN
tara:strand:+ start:2466 stop:3086 length:621 start_codon:yes stop_codon:yes gene_type:complete